VDNSYIFIFNRGGALALLAFACWACATLYRRWATWQGWQRATVIYLLVTALTLDTFIIRPLVSLWLAFGIAALAKAFSDEAEPVRG
jgi:hypothetical protein